MSVKEDYQRFDKLVSEVKEGDVWLNIQRCGGWLNKREVNKVEFLRKTKTQIIVLEDGRERRYRICNGALVGGTWGGMAFPLPASDKEVEEVRAEIRVHELRRDIRDFTESRRLDELSEQVLQQVMDLLGGQSGPKPRRRFECP